MVNRQLSESGRPHILSIMPSNARCYAGIWELRESKLSYRRRETYYIQGLKLNLIKS